MANSIARSAALAALLLTAPSFGQTRRVLPVDESARDPSLVAYLTKFKAAVAKRDRSALVPLIDPDVRLSFGSDSGVENFHPDWPQWDRLLAMGGALDEEGFSIPYVFGKFPDDLDAFEYAAITGRRVWLREAASSESRGIRQIDYEVVQIGSQGGDWWSVTTLRGVHGYVSSRYVYSPTGYRAFFQKVGGEWKMTAFLAGD